MGLALVAAVVLAACGSRVDREQSFAANGVVVDDDGTGVPTDGDADDESGDDATTTTDADGETTTTSPSEPAGDEGGDSDAGSTQDPPAVSAEDLGSGPLQVGVTAAGVYRYDLAGTDEEVVVTVTEVSADPPVQDWDLAEGDRSGRQQLAWEPAWIVEQEVSVDVLPGTTCRWDPPVPAVPREPEEGQTWDIESRCTVESEGSEITVVTTGTGEVLELTGAEVDGEAQRAVRVRRTEELNVQIGGNTAGSGQTTREQVMAASGVVAWERTTISSPIQNGDATRTLTSYEPA